MKQANIDLLNRLREGEFKPYCENNEIKAEGYDLENERLFLSLSGHGLGMGTLLVALNEVCTQEKDFSQLGEIMQLFSAELEEIILLDEYGFMASYSGLMYCYLSYSPDAELRTVIASNMNSVPLKTWQRLAQETDTEIVGGIIGNEVAPKEILKELSGHKYLKIRKMLAFGKHVSEDILLLLANENNPVLDQILALRPGTPSSVEAILLARDNPRTLESLAYRSTNSETLKILAKHRDHGVRGEVVSNRHTSLSTLLDLTKDPHPRVQGFLEGRIRTMRGKKKELLTKARQEYLDRENEL